ncbi:MAG: polymorphic toxin type 17 domain-containing protein [Sandaracinaceae bacterium]
MSPEIAGFTGKEADDEVGITYFGERWLIARVGRWASPDPLHVHASGGGEALNSYHYVGGNLLAGRDPVGLDYGEWSSSFDPGDGRQIRSRESDGTDPSEADMEFQETRLSEAEISWRAALDHATRPRSRTIVLGAVGGPGWTPRPAPRAYPTPLSRAMGIGTPSPHDIDRAIGRAAARFVLGIVDFAMIGVTDAPPGEPGLDELGQRVDEEICEAVGGATNQTQEEQQQLAVLVWWFFQVAGMVVASIQGGVEAGVTEASDAAETIVPSIRARMRAAGTDGLPGRRPRSEPFRYRPPEGYNPARPLPRNGRQGGFLDRFGNEWRQGPYHGDPNLGFNHEWDVQLSAQGRRWCERANPGQRAPEYLNVRPDGYLSH